MLSLANIYSLYFHYVVAQINYQSTIVIPMRTLINGSDNV